MRGAGLGRPTSMASELAELERSAAASRSSGSPAVRIDRRELLARFAGVGRDVELVGLPPAAERGVRPLARHALVREHEGVVDGEALGDVTGDRVAVDQRRIAVRGPSPGRPRRARTPLAASVDGEPRASGSTATTWPRSPLSTPQPEVVALDDDAVADGERAAGQRQLLGSPSAPACAHQRRAHARSGRRRRPGGGRSSPRRRASPAAHQSRDEPVRAASRRRARRTSRSWRR